MVVCSGFTKCHRAESNTLFRALVRADNVQYLLFAEPPLELAAGCRGLPLKADRAHVRVVHSEGLDPSAVGFLPEHLEERIPGTSQGYAKDCN